MKFAAGFILGAFTAAYVIAAWLSATPEEPAGSSHIVFGDSTSPDEFTVVYGDDITYTYSTS